MKTFDELTPEQQRLAIDHCIEALLTVILDGVISFNDDLNNDNLQARIDAAKAKAEQMQTPWFTSEYIMDTCREDIENMARCDAEDSLYSEPDEHVIEGIVKEPR